MQLLPFCKDSLSGSSLPSLVSPVAAAAVAASITGSTVDIKGISVPNVGNIPLSSGLGYPCSKLEMQESSSSNISSMNQMMASALTKNSNVAAIYSKAMTPAVQKLIASTLDRKDLSEGEKVELIAVMLQDAVVKDGKSHDETQTSTDPQSISTSITKSADSATSQTSI